jgi:hypothetical protein
MSDKWLQFVPSDASFQPSLQAAEKAKLLLGSFVPQATEIDFAFKDAVEFFHPGGNWSGVRCPTCGSDLEGWWSTAMDSSFKTGFSNLDTTVPCCGARVSLNDLDYVWPAGFARFVLEAMNPDVKDVSADQLQQISQYLACDIRRIWVHV